MDTAALPAPELERPRTVMVGTLVATAAASMAFLGLVGMYLVTRADTLAGGGSWYPEGAIQLAPGGMMMTSLVLSSFTVQWAVQAIATDDRSNAYIALFLTGLFGASVINQFWFVYTDVGFAVDDGPAELMFYVVTGSFLALLIAAIVFVAVTALRALIGQYGPGRHHGVAAAAIFWHAVVAMYAVIWIAIFITK